MTFLAVLELMKEQMIDAVQPEPFEEIRLIKKEIEGRANE
jgi:chromatin segregation and condensation protein Rec8/ScpA/Scc1 (kleisin family)